MKNIIFFLFALTVWSCEQETIDVPEDNLFENKLLKNEWCKISLSTNKNFKKVIAIKNEIILLTDDELKYYVCSSNFDHLEERFLPAKTSEPTPVLFKGYVYLNTNSGIYRYENGRKGWEKVTNWSAWEMTANKKNILAIKNDGQWGNDTIMVFDGFNFKPHPQIMAARDSINQKYNTTYTLGGGLQAIGDTIRFSYSHIARSGCGAALYFSYNNGKTWKTSWSLSGFNILEQFSCRESLGSVFSGQSGYGMSRFTIKNPWYYIDTYGNFYCLLSDQENFWFSAKKNKITGYDKIIKSYYGIFSSDGDSIITNKSINDIKNMNRHQLIAVGDSGMIYVLKKL